jgi:predicted transcriptional regulator
MTGKELREHRNRAGLPGHFVCRVAGICRSRLTEIERSYAEPKPDEVGRILRAINDLANARDRVAKLAAEVGWPL